MKIRRFILRLQTGVRAFFEQESFMKHNNHSSSKYSNAAVLGYFLKGSVLMFLISIVLNLFVIFLNVMIPQLIGFTVDSIIGTEEVPLQYAAFVTAVGGIEFLKRNIWALAVAVVALSLLMALFHYGSIYFNTRANHTLVCRMRNSLFSHLQKLPLKWHHEHNTGDIIQRCTTDMDAISNFVSNQLVYLFRIIILIALSMIYMFRMNVKLALIAAVLVPIIVLYSIIFYTRILKSFKKCDEEEGVLSTYAQENFTGVRVVRAFGRERYERDKFEKQNNYYTGLWVKVEKYLALFWTTGDMLTALQLMLTVILGTVFCVGGEISSGELIVFISYNTMLISPVRMLGRIISNLSRTGVSLSRIGEIMNAEEEDYGVATPLKGDIVFDDVSFSYEDVPVLEHISFRLREGETLGIIGGTGSGKSTIVQLIDRLYPVTSGKITIGGIDIRELSLATLRKQIGFVLQEGFLYSKTVGENIALAGEEGCDIRAAAKIACVDDNIQSFANGYDTIVGERGVTLSGGQKQRISIARTLLRKTPILILDDSLSAVDSETDAKIRARLEENVQGVTKIIIAHRITTVMHSDRIIVLDHGKISEEGNHEQLMQKNGIYRRIYDTQMSLPEEFAKEIRQ